MHRNGYFHFWFSGLRGSDARRKAAERSRIIQSLKKALREVPHTMYVKSLLRSNGKWGGFSALEDHKAAGVGGPGGGGIHADEVARGLRNRNLEVPPDPDLADVAEW